MANYFDAFTDRSVLSRTPLSPSDHTSKVRYLPAGSGWAKDQLRAARLVVRSATGRSEIEKKRNHVLPALREHFGEAETACSQLPILGLVVEPSDAGHGTLTETELVHKYGASLGSFWAALAQFGGVDVLEVGNVDLGEEDDDDDNDVDMDEDDDMDMDAGEGGKRPYSPGSDSSLPLPHKRVRTQRKFLYHTDTTKMKVGSSPSHKSSSPQPSQGSDRGHVSQDHASADKPEQYTVQIASAFLRHVLQACPPQHETQKYKPRSLVEFSAVSQRLVSKTATGVKIQATADGELVLHRLSDSRYNLTGHRPALLEAKKRFAVITDGEPELTDEFLGQMTCEALAFRLQQKQAKDAAPLDEKCVSLPLHTLCALRACVCD